MQFEEGHEEEAHGNWPPKITLAEFLRCCAKAKRLQFAEMLHILAPSCKLANLAPSRAPSWSSWAHLGVIWAHLGAMLVDSASSLAPTWRMVDALGAYLEHHGQKLMFLHVLENQTCANFQFGGFGLRGYLSASWSVLDRTDRPLVI